MSSSFPDNSSLDSNLRALSTYTGEPTALWQSALDQHAAARRPARPWLRIGLTLASAAVIILAVGAIITPTFNAARSSVGHIAFENTDGFAPTMDRPQAAAMPKADRFGSEIDEKRLRVGHDLLPSDNPRMSYDMLDMRAKNLAVETSDSSSPRSVIRKATIELAVPDPRDTFARCQHLLRLDLGEFVEGSTLSGQGPDARAQLTLRVAAAGDRLNEILNTLRTFGKVDSENATGDDVSAQVVDLDARLRNERQVETEVLKLLESRGGKDAQLKDILELREKLSSIRASIEQLQGRRDTLGRQISLASILVIIHPDGAPRPDPKPSSTFDAFSKEMSSAWNSGLSMLTSTISFLIRIAIGGLVWWLLLFAAIAVARRAIRHYLPNPAAIPTSA